MQEMNCQETPMECSSLGWLVKEHQPYDASVRFGNGDLLTVRSYRKSMWLEKPPRLLRTRDGLRKVGVTHPRAWIGRVSMRAREGKKSLRFSIRYLVHSG